jgi:hypothetical protein
MLRKAYDRTPSSRTPAGVIYHRKRLPILLNPWINNGMKKVLDRLLIVLVDTQGAEEESSSGPRREAVGKDRLDPDQSGTLQVGGGP